MCWFNEQVAFEFTFLYASARYKPAVRMVNFPPLLAFQNITFFIEFSCEIAFFSDCERFSLLSLELLCNCIKSQCTALRCSIRGLLSASGGFQADLVRNVIFFVLNLVGLRRNNVCTFSF